MASKSVTTSSESDPLGARFSGRLGAGRRALIPYITAGFPTPADTAGLLETLAGAGADVIELGVPFSDPLADGPTIQRASQTAIEAGGSLARALESLQAFRSRRDTPVVLFSYLNPVLRYGPDRFLEDAVAAGAQGVLLTDLPMGADPELEARFDAAPLSLVRLIAPTTPWPRALAIAERAQGFLYYISRTGVTGARSELPPDLSDRVTELRQAAGVPVVVGFGISTPDQAAAVARIADGVVVGSALVEIVGREGADGAARFIAALRRAVDEAL